jgi:hypothetical protein
MCVTCIDVETEVDELTGSPERRAKVDAVVRREALERLRRDPDLYRKCTECKRICCASEMQDWLPDLCCGCGLDMLERLFVELWESRGRKAEKKALRRLKKLARKCR